MKDSPTPVMTISPGVGLHTNVSVADTVDCDLYKAKSELSSYTWCLSTQQSIYRWELKWTLRVSSHGVTSTAVPVDSTHLGTTAASSGVTSAGSLLAHVMMLSR